MSSPQRLQVLAVDLDHTLIDTDMIYFGLKQIFLKKTYVFPYLFYLLLFKGKPAVKKYLYNNSIFDVNKIPFNEDLIKYYDQVVEKRNRNEYSLPSTIEKELNINPFLRSSIEEVRKSAEIYSSKANLDDVGVLAVIRSWKDNF